MLLALASGALLLAVVGQGLVHGMRQAHDRAELASRRDARDLATALRALLRSPDVVALVPPERRVHWTNGSLAVDAEVGWLQQAPRRAPDAVIDERLRLAALAEFSRGDAPAAAAGYDEMLAQDGARDGDLLPVLAAAAWHAQRTGDAERANSLAQRLTDAVVEHTPAAVAEPLVADAVAATALLTAARACAFPDELRGLLAALPDALANATLLRLRERGAPVDGLATAHAQVAARRNVLREAAAAVRDLPRTPVARVAGEQLVLWFPAAATGDGDGALVDAAWIAALPGLGTARPSPAPNLPPVPDRGVVRFGATAHADAEEVVPGFAYVLPAPPPPLPWTSHPGTLLGAALLLGLVFTISAAAMLRAAGREASALRARTEFLTGVTHELKTPLAAIRLVADVLRDDDVPPGRQREYFALLAGETARLSGLIENVLDLGRSERGERVYDLRAGDLAAVVRDAVTTFAPLSQRSGIAIAVHEGVATAPAAIDHGALMQALLAVLENARKYAAAGQRIELTTAGRAGTFEVTVRDFGAGVPADERETVFDRFQRGSAHRHGAIPGVGLGLFLARAIVEHHGGTLRCEPPPEGTGACFVFSLPLAEVEP